MTPGATVESSDRIRLFVALEVPVDVSDVLRHWGEQHLQQGRRVDSFHVTLAFLGAQSRSNVGAIAEVMRREAADTDPFVLAPVGYPRSVGMLVLGDPSGYAASLAERVQRGLEHLGVYEREHRAWLPHITCLRFRARPGLDPPLPELEPFAPSGVAALLSRLHPSGARYEVLESCSVGRRGG